MYIYITTSSLCWGLRAIWVGEKKGVHYEEFGNCTLDTFYAIKRGFPRVLRKVVFCCFLCYLEREYVIFNDISNINPWHFDSLSSTFNECATSNVVVHKHVKLHNTIFLLPRAENNNMNNGQWADPLWCVLQYWCHFLFSFFLSLPSTQYDSYKADWFQLQLWSFDHSVLFCLRVAEHPTSELCDLPLFSTSNDYFIGWHALNIPSEHAHPLISLSTFFFLHLSI